MKKWLSMVALVVALSVVAGCATTGAHDVQTANTDQLQIVATSSIIGDLVQNVVGERGEVFTLVPVGTDPHDYEPLPQDVQKVSDADLIFYNGLNLETGGGWFDRLVSTAGKVEGTDYFVVSQGVEPMYLTGEGQENQQDPHAWLDIQHAITYVENIEEILSHQDPEGATTYQANAAAYITKLEALDRQARQQFADIPPEKKLLVSSEGAFKYFSAAYDLTAAYIWEINTESQGTPEQMTRIIDTVRAWDVPVVFVETSVDPRSMEQVAAETGLPIYATIYTDSLDKEGQPGETYYGMMEWNLEQIAAGLSSEK